MRFFAKWSCAALMVAWVFTGSASAAQVTETFTGNTDTYWDGAANRTDPQSYGWSDSDNTGAAVNPPGPDGIPGNGDDGVATGAGELGGILSRNSSTPSFYGFDVGGIDPATEGFNVSGVINVSSADGAIFIGYHTGTDSFADVNGDLKNFAGILLNDGQDVFAQFYTRNRNRTGGELPTLDIAAGTPTPFALEYTPPPGGTGGGSLRVSVGSASATSNFENGFAAITDPLTHFGIFPQRNGTSTMEVYFDDLTFTSDNPIPEPAGLALLGMGVMIGMRRRRV